MELSQTSQGKYEIIVNDSRATLVFSYIGFTTHETVVGANREIDVLMSAISPPCRKWSWPGTTVILNDLWPVRLPV
jgi:hypothetical protein